MKKIYTSILFSLLAATMPSQQVSAAAKESVKMEASSSKPKAALITIGVVLFIGIGVLYYRSMNKPNKEKSTSPYAHDEEDTEDVEEDVEDKEEDDGNVVI